ncbi:MAG: YbjQ family protein [Salinivirgaceae bacterium]|nr:YbjQ family protein [Salinivirgaceae bacterium]MDD4747015.1 YbjQ family protein [Salinivirgaceae bacterium]MDY0279095.1 YbjQ family protein [Salinivirgaceae bacterium]
MNFITTTTEKIEGYNIVKTIGITRGSTVRARNIGRDIFAGLKNMVGGEISEYTKLLADSREQALERMTNDAKKMGANAIVSVRLTTSTVMQGCAEILAYGTAVIIEPCS